MGKTLCLVFCLLAALPGAPASAAEFTPTELPLPGVFDLAVDDEHRRVFVSGGTHSTKVAMLNFNGEVTGVLENIPGPTGLEVVDSRLYVAASGAARIERYDLTTSPPTRLTSISTEPLVTPRDLVYLAGKLWFASECGQWTGHIGGINVDGTGLVEVPNERGSWDYCPSIDGGRYAPNRLFAMPTGLSPNTLYEYDVSTNPPTFVTERRDFGGGDLEPMPNGTTFGMGTCTGISEYRNDDFYGPIFTYIAQTCLGAGVDVTAGGPGLVAGASSDGHVWLYRLGVPEAFRVIDLFGPSYASVVWNAFAVSNDGTRVFLVGGNYSETPQFYTVDPNAYPTALSLSAKPTSITFGDGVALAGEIDPVTPGLEVSLFEINSSGGRKKVGTDTTDAEGRYDFVVFPDASSYYQVRFHGTSTLMPSRSPEQWVSVKPTVSLSLRRYFGVSGKYRLYRKRDDVVARASVAPDHSGRTVRFHTWTRQRGQWQPLGYPSERELSSSSAANMTYSGLEVGRYRLQADISAHDDHSSGASEFAFFEVVEKRD